MLWVHLFRRCGNRRARLLRLRRAGLLADGRCHRLSPDRARESSFVPPQMIRASVPTRPLRLDGRIAITASAARRSQTGGARSDPERSLGYPDVRGCSRFTVRYVSRQQSGVRSPDFCAPQSAKGSSPPGGTLSNRNTVPEQRIDTDRWTVLCCGMLRKPYTTVVSRSAATAE